MSKFKLKILFVFFMLSGIAVCLPAQSKKASSNKSYFVPDPIKNMETLLGDWEGSIHSETGPVVTSKELKVSLSFSSLFNGRMVQVGSIAETVGGKDIVESYGVIAYDTSEKQVHLMLYTDTCEVFTLTGNWANRFNLNFSGSTTKSGKKIKMTLWLGVKIKDQIDYKLYTTIDNTLISETGQLKRKSKN